MAINTRNAIWSVGYSLFQAGQGLLLHPYQTMRQLVRERVFAWVALFPMVLWIFAVLAWRVLEVTLFSLIPYPTFWLFLALWFTVAIIFEQILLLYLAMRFIFLKRS